jgi:SAM-dependent MidA family methyltransferase
VKILKQRTKWRRLQGKTSADYVCAHKDASMQATEQDLAEHVDFTKIEEMNL